MTFSFYQSLRTVPPELNEAVTLYKLSGWQRFTKLEVVKTFGLGLLTLARVLVLLVFATLIWTPIGVAIGFNPRVARLLQPVVQFLASFPANFIFPFATLFFIRSGISINWGRYAELFEYDAGEDRLYLPEAIEAGSRESESME